MMRDDFARANEVRNYRVLEDGGEAGQIIKSIDWTDTLGPVESWPLSLVNTLGLMLHGAFPMFLFWGKDLTCFYNDAFSKILGGNRKHPVIGMKGKDVWVDVWSSIGPLLESVMVTGKTVVHEDQPGFFRESQFEDIYWSVSYSPAYNDKGAINGVLVTCIETTRNVIATRKLAESENRFRKMAGETDIMIAIGDEAHNLTFFNKAWMEFTGRNLDQLVSFGWTNIVHADDREHLLSLYARACAQQEPWVAEFRVLNRYGEYRWLLVKATNRSDEEGRFIGHVAACIDITDRKRAEERLRESEHRLREIIESAPFPIGVYVGRDMRIALVNQSILDVWGRGRNIIGRTYSEVLPELEEQLIYPQLDQVFTTGKPFHARNRRVDLMLDGKLQEFYFNYSFTPLFDTKGNVYGVMNTAADVTDVHLAKKKVEQSEANLRNMVLQAPVAMTILLGSNHVVEVANDLIIELWGKPRAAVMHKPVFDALPDARNQGLETVMDGVYHTGETYVANERPVSLIRNGKLDTLYLNFVYAPYKDSSGKVIGVLATSSDVTSQVLARLKIEEIVAERTKELAVANLNLEKSNSELAQFAYIASHDLQEPVRKIRTYTQLLQRHIAESGDTVSLGYLTKIENSSARMHALIRDVLMYSELDKVDNKYVLVSLSEVIQSIETDFELMIEQKKAKIRVGTLPVIKGSPVQMFQLFGNLISNALKFSRQDRIPEISINSKRIDGSIIKRTGQSFYHITISDNGIGFKKEFAEQIFHIFQRLHGKSEYEGTGIGLAMCRKIVQNHYGMINADGSSEDGALFNIFLPVP